MKLPPAIRHATAADAAALATFAAEVFPLGCPNTAPSDLAAYIAAELTAERFTALIADPNIIVLLAEASGLELPSQAAPSRRIVAYMVVARRNPHPALSALAPAELRKLYLHPSVHGNGLSSALLHCALSILNAERPRPIWLTTFSQNSRAIAFYKKWGFEIVGEQTFIVGTDHQKDVLMLRPAHAADEAGG